MLSKKAVLLQLGLGVRKPSFAPQGFQGKKIRKLQQYDCVVIGAGPAGSIAALYLQRFKRKILLIDRGGSRVLPVPLIRNLVGYSEGISGKDLLKKLHRQLVRFDVPFIRGEAALSRKGNHFQVKVNGKSFFSKYVILATGFKDRQPKGVNFFELCKKGALAYCPICDGYDHSGETVAVLLDSNEGFHKVKFLSHFSKRLHIVLLQDLKIPTRHLEKVYKFGVSVHRGELETLEYKSSRRTLVIKLRDQKAFEVKMAYVAMGFQVSTEAFDKLRGLRRNKEGLILVDDHQRTSLEGLYAVGDCVKSLAQVSVGIGHAAIAATHVHNQLSHRD